jgi:outer membrane protein assembly factor BamB
MPALAFAAPRSNSASNWENVNGNSWGWNYSPQTQINQDNVDELEIKWLFPFPGEDRAPAGILAASGGSTVTTPPIVVDGNVYAITSYMMTLAIDATTGKQLWTHQYDINVDEISKRLPLQYSGAVHKHGFQYWERGNTILNHGMACDIYGVDKDSGEETLTIENLCADMKGAYGNQGLYLARRFGAEPSIGVYDKGNMFIYHLSSAIHSNIESYGREDARHVTLGIDQNSGDILWRIFNSPPQDVPTKDWALQECATGWFREIPCSEAEAANRAGLEWDFALPGEAIREFSGVTANWGMNIVDEETGTMYTQTGNQGPYSNMTLAPGPRLYGSTIMAIDLDKGVRQWWLQPFPHDPYDYDCNWSGMLVENPTLGKVYVYGCKEGRYFAMDSETGKPKLTIDVRDDMYARGQISTDPHTMVYEPDPRSYYDMREWNWISYPASVVGEPGATLSNTYSDGFQCTLPCEIFPHWSNGVFATDRAFDPDTQTYFLYEDAIQVTILEEHSYWEGERNYAGGKLFTTKATVNTNSTLVARDMATGEVKWTFFNHYHQRAAPVSTGGMVFIGQSDGFLRFFDKNNGELLNKIPVGSGIVIQPTVGQDGNGDSKIFTIIGASSRGGRAAYGMADTTTVPGTLAAFGLREKAAESVATTVTSTSKTTFTVTSEVTEEVGMSSTVTYAAIAVAVIAIIGAAVLYTRKQ